MQTDAARRCAPRPRDRALHCAAKPESATPTTRKIHLQARTKPLLPVLAPRLPALAPLPVPPRPLLQYHTYLSCTLTHPLQLLIFYIYASLTVAPYSAATYRTGRANTATTRTNTATTRTTRATHGWRRYSSYNHRYYSYQHRRRYYPPAPRSTAHLKRARPDPPPTLRARTRIHHAPNPALRAGSAATTRTSTARAHLLPLAIFFVTYFFQLRIPCS